MGVSTIALSVLLAGGGANLQDHPAIGTPGAVTTPVPEVAAPERWGHIVAKTVEDGLRDARAQMGATVPGHWTSDVRTGSAAGVLVEAAKGRHALIVVGLSGIQDGHRPGTTAYRVLWEADAPVLAVPGG